jgi:hypothetical protein
MILLRFPLATVSLTGVRYITKMTQQTKYFAIYIRKKKYVVCVLLSVTHARQYIYTKKYITWGSGVRFCLICFLNLVGCSQCIGYHTTKKEQVQQHSLLNNRYLGNTLSKKGCWVTEHSDWILPEGCKTVGMYCNICGSLARLVHASIPWR